MFECYICRRNIPQEAELIRHLRNFHALYEGSALTLHCCVPSCVSAFKTFSGLRKHIKKCPLKRKHYLNNSDPNHSNAFTPGQCSLHDTVKNIDEYDCHNNDGKVVEEHAVENNDGQVVPDRLIESYVSKLYALGIPDSTIQVIVNCTSELFDTLLETNPQVNVPKQFKNLFQNYRSKHIRDCHFNDLIVKPVEIPIGTRFDQKWNKTTKQYNQVPVTCSFTYVPILETLKFLLSNKSFLSILTCDEERNSCVISDYCQGSNFRNSNLFSENQPCLQIQLYFDEFETVNPLGSKTGGHKLGAVYYIIRNLPSAYNSVHQNIHLLALYYSADVKSFGINKILDKIVCDVRHLETVGIFEESLQKHIKGTIVAISHDNLGGNQLFGLVESFSSKHFCRICIADKNTTQILCEQDDSKLRTTYQYEQLCLGLENNVPFGIKHRSVLNDLTHFKIFENFSADVMHDILEGVGPLEIKLFLKYIIKEKILSLEEINNRLKSFNLGYNEMCNKSSPINLDKTGNLIGERAAQTWCLLRFLPLLLGDVLETLSEKQTKKFKVIKLLLEIVDIVFCPVNTYGMVLRLKELISTHHHLFKVEYNHSLTPKHHFMIHYPMIIMSSGPLVGLWCMRFESKHAYFKNLCTKLKNYKSLSKTLAFRHQKYMWHEWQHLNLTIGPTYGKCKLISTSDVEYKNNVFLSHAFEFASAVELLITEYVTLLGCTFKKGLFLVQEIGDDAMPIFVQIKCLFIDDDLPYAICVPWKTLDFDETYHAYIIEEPSSIEYVAVNISSLKHAYAYELHHPFDCDASCIVLKYEIVIF